VHNGKEKGRGHHPPALLFLEERPPYCRGPERHGPLEADLHFAAEYRGGAVVERVRLAAKGRVRQAFVDGHCRAVRVYARKAVVDGHSLTVVERVRKAVVDSHSLTVDEWARNAIVDGHCRVVLERVRKAIVDGHCRAVKTRLRLAVVDGYRLGGRARGTGARSRVGYRLADLRP
jgi:hypothetical protein